MNNTDLDAKAIALQGIRSIYLGGGSQDEVNTLFCDEIIKCFTTPNRFLLYEALEVANNLVPLSFILNDNALISPVVLCFTPFFIYFLLFIYSF